MVIDFIVKLKAHTNVGDNRPSLSVSWLPDPEIVMAHTEYLVINRTLGFDFFGYFTKPAIYGRATGYRLAAEVNRQHSECVCI